MSNMFDFLSSLLTDLVARDYKVRKFPNQQKWGIYDRHTGERKAVSTSEHNARVAAHIKDDNSKKYPK